MSVSDEGLELDQPCRCIVGGTDRLGEEKFDRLAGAPCDVLEGRQRRSRASGLDQINRRCGDVTLPQLREAESGFGASLLDRTGAKVDAGKPSAFGRVSRNWCV